MVATIDMVHRYQMGAQIESGSQGQVISALDTVTNKQVAIKVFPISTEMGSAGFASDYLIHKIMKGNSKRICSVLDCFQIPNNLGFIVMRKYQQDLFDLAFSSEKKLTDKQIKRIFLEICKGIRDLHRKGVAHLDIKPENILVDKKKNPYICDFGSSYIFKIDGYNQCEKLSKKVRKSVIEKLRGRGTRRYAAPEVFTSDVFNPFSADIFSLGVMLHALVTGFFPVVSGGSVDLNFEVAKQKMSRNSFALMTSMMQIDPTKRPSIEKVLSSEWFGRKPTMKNAVKLMPFASI